MDKKVFAFDLDGTLTEHRTWITDENIEMLDKLREKGIRLLIVGAGQFKRIYTQMREYPIDIIANYGLQYAEYDREEDEVKLIRDNEIVLDEEKITEIVNDLRNKLGFTEYKGASTDYHKSGCVVIPLLGTKSTFSDRMTFDPDGKKRRAVLQDIKDAFPEYTVFIGGSSSFDMVPHPYNKYYALDLFCKENGYSHSEVLYFGDDYGEGGNDETVFKSDIDCEKVERSEDLPKIVEKYIK